MKMKQALLFFITAFFITGISVAQTKREILEEDPKLSPNLRLELSPLDFKTATPYMFGGVSAKISYRASKFSISGEFRKEYFDYEEGDLNVIQDGYIMGNPKPYSGYGLEFAGTFFFKSNEKEIEEMLPIKSRSVGYRTIEVTVDPVSTTKLALYGIRAGYAMDKATFESSGDVSEVGNPSNTQTDAIFIPLETRSFFFGGLSMTRIKNIKVRYPTYGNRRRQFIREYYADVLFGGDPKADNVVEYTSGTPVTYKIDKYTVDRSIGWRLGIASTPTGRLVNVGYGFELASMPGGSFGINVKLLFSLMKKVGLSEE